MTGRLAVAVVLLPWSCATGQLLNSLAFEFPGGSIYEPGGPPVTVEVWAHWDPAYYCFGWAHFDVLGDPSGGFSGMASPFSSLPQQPGTATGGNVTGIGVGQLYFPIGPLPNWDNPVRIWWAEWSTSDPTPRVIDLETVTSTFVLYVPSGMAFQFPSGEAHAKIYVNIPAPAAAMALLCGLAAPLSVHRRR